MEDAEQIMKKLAGRHSSQSVYMMENGQACCLYNFSLSAHTHQCYFIQSVNSLPFRITKLFISCYFQCILLIYCQNNNQTPWHPCNDYSLNFCNTYTITMQRCGYSHKLEPSKVYDYSHQLEPSTVLRYLHQLESSTSIHYSHQVETSIVLDYTNSNLLQFLAIHTNQKCLQYLTVHTNQNLLQYLISLFCNIYIITTQRHGCSHELESSTVLELTVLQYLHNKYVDMWLYTQTRIFYCILYHFFPNMHIQTLCFIYLNLIQKTMQYFLADSLFIARTPFRQLTTK